jgi:hypothetical protein
LNSVLMFLHMLRLRARAIAFSRISGVAGSER